MTTKKRTLHIKPITIFDGMHPQDAFAHFADQPYSMFFDSASHPSGQFDILLFAPEMVFTEHQFETKASLFSELTSLQTTYFSNDVINVSSDALDLYTRLPFVVGIAGSFGYELNRFLEVLPTPKNTYKTPDLIAGIFFQSIIYDREHAIYYHCYLGEETPDLSHFINNSPETKFALLGDWKADKNQSEYEDAIDKIHQYILAGDCYQVNFAMRFMAEYEGNEYAAYCLLSRHNQAPFSSFIRTEHGAILSISPERFLQINERSVTTKPIKGTMPRFSDALADRQSAQTLIDSEKNRAENLMIVDLLRNDLSKHCEAYSVKVPKLFALESYPAVHHLVSTIEGQLAPGVHPWELFAGAFPGGSITGAPKVRAMEVIHELEDTARHIYCGSIGYLGIKEDMDTNIAIRTLLCEEGNIYCWAGGGIVLDSKAKDEYAELYAKVSKILPVLKDTNISEQR